MRLTTIFMDHANQSQRRWLACHEVGHAIGLRHRNSGGCMEKCVIMDPEYTAHDIAHFNENWAGIGASGSEPGC